MQDTPRKDDKEDQPGGGQILEEHDLGEDSTRQANLEAAFLPNHGTLWLHNDDNDYDGAMHFLLLVWPTSWTPAVGGLFVCESVSMCVALCMSE